MNEFDRYLETELRAMLNPVVAARPPTRRGRLREADQPARPPLPVDVLAAEAIPIVVVPAVTLPIAPASPL